MRQKLDTVLFASKLLTAASVTFAILGACPPLSPDPSDSSQAVGLAADPFADFHGDDGIFIPDSNARHGDESTAEPHSYTVVPSSGFGGYIGHLRRDGLDAVLIIDGSARSAMGTIRERIEPLTRAIHRLVPIGRLGIVVFGEEGAAVREQPLTVSADKLQVFLDTAKAGATSKSNRSVLAALDTAVNKMDFKPCARKVIVVIGGLPLCETDLASLLPLAAKFKSEGGLLNAIDTASEIDHPPSSVLPQLAAEGGGSMKFLKRIADINEQILVLDFDERWQSQVEAFGRSLR